MERKSSETKMVIVMRKDLHMPKGKFVAQGSHASLGVVLDIKERGTDLHKEILEQWLGESYVKVCLQVSSLEELQAIYEEADSKRMPVKLITDNGLTIFNGVKTVTCLAILGYRDEVDAVTGHLKLL